MLFALPTIGFIVTVLFIYIFFKLSYKFRWFDKPDEERKSHTIAKPTSAGIAFMSPIVLLAIFIPHVSLFSSPYFIAALIVLIIVGAYDDFKSLSVKLRMLVISLASVTIITLFFDFGLGNWIVLLIYFLGVIWWMNLFNFMDGADGMAGLHALVAICGYTLYFLLFSSMEVVYLLYLLFVIACIFSFLLFNFPQAKIFMGDSGSLSLSFLIAAIALHGISQGIFDEFVVISFHLVFIVDATLTLFTRIKYKQPMTQAHNLHLYQALIVSGKPHTSISLHYALVSLIITAITLYLRYLNASQVAMFLVLVIETVVLCIYWYKFHNKTKFERFIR